MRGEEILPLLREGRRFRHKKKGTAPYIIYANTETREITRQCKLSDGREESKPGRATMKDIIFSDKWVEVSTQK